ncbi:MAG: JAB domain-containing protein [Sediminibacterium sp.]|nr:JAB domain-containing protein [Sediminibacterium sp.]
MQTDSNSVAEISVSYRPSIADKPIIKSTLDAYNILRKFFSEDTIQLQEQFVALYLNRSNRVLGCYKLSIGGITGTVADTRLILSVALKTAATAIIIGHNHPSGNLVPSQADIQLSKKILEASKIMDIILFDHIILCANGKYLSFADEGLI